MNEPAGDHFSWGCPACSRRVPTRFDECRCGFKKEDLPPVAVDAPVPAVPARGGPSAPLVLILGAAVGIGIAVYIVQSHRTAPAARVATTSARPITEAPPIQQPVAEASETFVPPFTGSITPTRQAAPDAPVDASGPASIEDVVSSVLPAVASIDTGTARGSGFFVRP